MNPTPSSASSADANEMGSTSIPWNLATTDNGTLLLSTISDASDEDGSIPIGRIIICAILFVIVLFTIVGNTVVLLAFVVEKKLLHNNYFNYYVINLAVTDVLVAVTAMTFYTFDILLGYWPFGEFMCGVWIFFDYGMTFASVFTLVAISIDRFWSVTWSIHYRTNNNKQKIYIAIALIWILVLVVWLPPCVMDRLKWSEPGVCKWEPSNNREFVYFIASCGHHLPCVVMVVCYIKVFSVMTRRFKGKPSRNRAKVEPTTISTVAATDGASVVNDAATLTETSGGTKAKSQGSSDSSERKIFLTMTSIIWSYLFCWVPFHVVFDCSSIDPALVPEPLYTATFWLTYFNSSLNPLLYAFSNRDLRNAFKKVFKCQTGRN